MLLCAYFFVFCTGDCFAVPKICLLAKKESKDVNYISNYNEIIHYHFYDELNRLTEATDWKGRKTTYAYDELGNRTKTSLPNGVVTDYVYDEMNRVTGISSGIGTGKELLSFSYAYDELGNKTSENKNGKSTSYEYDALSQLISVMPETGKETAYTYDNVGNRLTKSEINASSLLTTNYEYNQADELLKITEHSGKVTNYDYDQNGNRVKKTVLTPELPTPNSSLYAYDFENRLKEVLSPNGKTTSFTYDGEGNRIKKAVKNPDELEPQAKDITEYVWERTPRLPLMGDCVRKCCRPMTVMEHCKALIFTDAKE